jgi:hypothetical protein
MLNWAVAQVIAQYNQTVRPMHLQYVEPSKRIADLVVHSTDSEQSDNSHASLDVACKVLTNHLIMTAGLKFEKPASTMEEALVKIAAASGSTLQPDPNTQS